MMQGTKWQFGRAAEEEIELWLKSQGFMVVPTRLIESGGAPKMLGWVQSQAVLPDTLALRDGPRWVEIKAKRRAVKYQKANEWRTGIDLRHWRDYMLVQEQSGINGWLCFVHIEERIINVASLFALSKVVVEETHPRGYSADMAMFPLWAMESFPLSECSHARLRALSTAPARRVWEPAPLKRAPVQQLALFDSGKGGQWQDNTTNGKQ